MAVKNNRRTLVTKRILKESLLSLMAEKPITKISIKEICDLSEMSRSTFYLHYQDQFELLKDIENEVLDKSFEALEDLGGDFNTIESIENFLNYVKSSKETFGVLLCQTDTIDFQNAIIEKISNHVKESVPDFNQMKSDKYIFVFIMNGSLNVLRTWIMNDFDMAVPEMASLIFQCNHNITTTNNS
ncbi:transcriptional regulator, TetR family [Pseudobutyrivibrio sp. YE44]|uniref:TetR/AcrR family transcriptional regulator n=1 Tax=Pseudobutyrivibrio sp. YE44 TaxID=1520802 RepID=UPI000887A971|nr:TetR/AcrR family transcriptional regulator C-terminal domain-containing protein [Pseudobutyrivibrio sp. YE44]SDB15632.1 transcriptional regulator, TetR family [Pseudobutyrivibrio sp. YE44]